MLIDCGIHLSVSGGQDFVCEIAEDIRRQTGGKIDVLIVTHEHWDHVSGFTHAASIFKDMDVGEVWMAWSENPKDPDAIAFDKFRGDAVAALQGASKTLDGLKGANPYLTSLRDGLQSVMSFQFGAAGERVRAARDAAASLSKRQPPLYLGPETAPFSIADLPSIRIYVLGPPRSKESLSLETKQSEMFPLTGLSPTAFLKPLASALALNETADNNLYDYSCPFDPHVGTPLSVVLAGKAAGETAKFVQRHYLESLPAQDGESGTDDEAARDQSWRRIDADWLGVAADLAMQLDRGVNNTSLVLAFELVDSGRVFLFPGDAQIGNWLSWQDVKWTVAQLETKATDLVARTVYLKVAHHGSENATPDRNGLGMMASADLSAFIPTSKADALKVRWGSMPYDGIVEALAKKAGGRVIRADDEWLASKDGRPGFSVPSGSILAVRHAPRDARRGKGGLWVEVDLA